MQRSYVFLFLIFLGSLPLIAQSGILAPILLGGGASAPAIALVNHNAAYVSGATALTTATNMTGATLLVMACESGNAGSTFTPSDSSSNTWTSLTRQSGGSNALQLFYAVNPTVTGSQTFQCVSTNTFAGVLAEGFSGTLTTAGVFDAQSGTNATSPMMPGSITPAQAGEVFVTAAANNGAGTTPSIDSGFTITDSNSSGSFEIAAMAYLVNAGSSAQNPTWTLGSASTNAAMAAFKHP